MEITIDKQNLSPRIKKTGTLVYSELTNTLFIKSKNKGVMQIGSSFSSGDFVEKSTTIDINGVVQDLSTSRTWTIFVPTKTSELTNDSGFITTTDLSSYLTITSAAATYQPIGSYLTSISGLNISQLTNDSGFITSSALSGYELLSNKSTSTSLGTSDSLYPTQNAVKQYVDTGLSGKQNTLGYTPEDVANKTTTITGNESSDTKYPTVKALYDWSTGLFATQSSLVGYVPTSRTITINGTTQDLSSNRSWTIHSGVSSLNTLTGSVSIKAGSGIDINISGSDIEITNTGSGINIDGGVSNSTYGTLTPIDGGVA